MLKVIFVSTLVLSALALAAHTVQGRSTALSCTSEQLNSRDCLLQWERLRIHIRAQTLLVHDGTWRALADMPLQGPAVEWVSVRFREVNDRPLVEMLLWSEPRGEASIQSLTWVVAELKSASIEFVLSEVVARRRHIEQGERGRILSSLEDQREKFGLKPMDGQGPIHWWVGRRSGKF